MNLNDTEKGQLIDFPSRLAPPADWLNLDQVNYVALPAIGAQVTIVSFMVPDGYNGIIKAIANNFVGGGWTEGSGDVTWQVLVDKAPPAGANSYNLIPASLGSPANPTRIAGFRIAQGQLVELVAQNNAVVVAGQKVGGRLLGYLYPLAEETDDAWA